MGEIKHPFEIAALAEGGMPVAAGLPTATNDAQAKAFVRAALAEDGMPISAGGPGAMPFASVRPFAVVPSALAGAEVGTSPRQAD